MTHQRGPNRLNTAIAGAANRLARRRTLLGVIVALVGAFLGYISWVSINGIPFQHRYKVYAVISKNSPIMKKGDAVRESGKLAGFVTGVDPYKGNVKLTMELRPGYAPIGEDAHVNIRVRSIVYLKYVEILPGDLSHPLPEGGTVPLANTGSGVDLLEVVQLFDKRARNALRRSTYSLGVGLAGRGDELNAALADLRDVAHWGSPELQAVASHPGAVARTIAGGARVTNGLRGERPDDVASLITSGSRVLATAAGRQSELGRTIDALRPLSDEYLRDADHIDPLLGQSAELARRLNPAVKELASVLPDVNATMALGDVLRRQTGRLARDINPVLREVGPILVALRPVVASIGSLIPPLNALNNTLDPYKHDITLAGIGLRSATTQRYSNGATAPNNPALRFVPVLTCHKPRDPYPGPGEPRRHSQSC